jgi:hypothetical protein
LPVLRFARSIQSDESTGERKADLREGVDFLVLGRSDSLVIHFFVFYAILLHLLELFLLLGGEHVVDLIMC